MSGSRGMVHTCRTRPWYRSSRLAGLLAAYLVVLARTKVVTLVIDGLIIETTVMFVGSRDWSPNAFDVM